MRRLNTSTPLKVVQAYAQWPACRGARGPEPGPGAIEGQLAANGCVISGFWTTGDDEARSRCHGRSDHRPSDSERNRRAARRWCQLRYGDLLQG